ncbi:MAG: hypothetical protein ACREQ5_04630 [Candidatus Dormibacteria bacterium]
MNEDVFQSEEGHMKFHWAAYKDGARCKDLDLWLSFDMSKIEGEEFSRVEQLMNILGRTLGQDLSALLTTELVVGSIGLGG